MDLPCNNARVQNSYSDFVQNVDNMKAGNVDNVDVVQNNSSSSAKKNRLLRILSKNVDVAQNNDDYDSDDDTEVQLPTC